MTPRPCRGQVKLLYRQRLIWAMTLSDLIRTVEGTNPQEQHNEMLARLSTRHTALIERTSQLTRRAFSAARSEPSMMACGIGSLINHRERSQIGRHKIVRSGGIRPRRDLAEMIGGSGREGSRRCFRD